VAVNRAQVLVVGVPGRMQESLRTLLKAVPDLEVIGTEKGGWPFADVGDAKPDLAVLDFGRPTDELTRDLVWIKAHWPATSCLVVVDTARQVQTVKAAGADGALLRGFAAGEFFAALRDLLKDRVCLGFVPAQPDSETSSSASASSPSLGDGQALLASPAVF
jgi:DNA-binding NarL/FixJ family response regulator